MAVQNISSSNNMLIQATESNLESNSVINSSDFLELLMIQYQNQDPLEPISDTESLAQMAEFSSLDMIEKMMASQSTTQMYSLLGKDITYTVEDVATGQETLNQGSVESVVTQNGKTQLKVNDDYIDLTQIYQVNTSASINSVGENSESEGVSS